MNVACLHNGIYVGSKKLNEESRTTPRIFADSQGSWVLPKLITAKFATGTFLRFPLITMISVLPSFSLSFRLAIQIFKLDERWKPMFGFINTFNLDVQLCVICKKVVTNSMSFQKKSKCISVHCKQYWTKDRALWDTILKGCWFRSWFAYSNSRETRFNSQCIIMLCHLKLTVNTKQHYA